ncbi:MAG: hypothetical protein FWH10_06340, partial [Oscillospiraceae bacterium]|nr:hypothetical protein [Oscillospiraceae bacterium]
KGLTAQIANRGSTTITISFAGAPSTDTMLGITNSIIRIPLDCLVQNTSSTGVLEIADMIKFDISAASAPTP